MNRIATAEDLQAELRTLWAMTEEPNPSREKMAAALNGLATRLAGTKSQPELLKKINVMRTQKTQPPKKPIEAAALAKVCSEVEKLEKLIRATFDDDYRITIMCNGYAITD